MCKTCELKKRDEGYEKACEEMREKGYERDEFGEWEKKVVLENTCEICGNDMSEEDTRYDDELWEECGEGIYCVECYDDNVVKD